MKNLKLLITLIFFQLSVVSVRAITVTLDSGMVVNNQLKSAAAHAQGNTKTTKQFIVKKLKSEKKKRVNGFLMAGIISTIVSVLMLVNVKNAAFFDALFLAGAGGVLLILGVIFLLTALAIEASRNSKERLKDS